MRIFRKHRLQRDADVPASHLSGELNKGHGWQAQYADELDADPSVWSAIAHLKQRATVHAQHLAGHEVGPDRGEVQDGSGHLLRLGEGARQRPAASPFCGVLG